MTIIGTARLLFNVSGQKNKRIINIFSNELRDQEMVKTMDLREN